MSKYVGAIDQGTTSRRASSFSIVRARSSPLDQKEHEQISPRPGWVEHDPAEIWRNTQTVIAAPWRRRVEPRRSRQRRRHQPARDDRHLESPHRRGAAQCAGLDGHAHRRPRRANSTADGGQDRLRAKTGLPLATYFSGLKLRWLLDHAPGARKSAEGGDVLFGTMDSWIAWNLTGGVTGRQAHHRRHQRLAHPADESRNVSTGIRTS